MEAALQALLPKLLGATSFRVYPHQCKDQLLERLPERLQGYAGWIPESWRILVLLDRDQDDCRLLKDRLENWSVQAGLPTRTRPAGSTYLVINRLAVEELEAWYFGDWQAVRAAFPKAPTSIPMRAGYRDPDQIAGGTWEAFERVLQKAGYFRGGLRKIEAARAIAPHLEPSRNRSRSFQVLCQALREIASPPALTPSASPSAPESPPRSA